MRYVLHEAYQEPLLDRDNPEAIARMVSLFSAKMRAQCLADRWPGRSIDQLWQQVRDEEGDS
ncbi:MAG: hypothetical protein ACOC00_08660 [Halothiobacillaceae bacterium]